jgi:hypothetical protein
MKVTELTPGHVLVQVGDKTARVNCEMLIPTPGMSDFLVDRNSARNWEPPCNAERIDGETREGVIEIACDYLTNLGRVVELVSW